MKSLFDEISRESSKLVTRKYSTSFSLGILFLNKRLRTPIYSIYGFVRLADEIVDSFHSYNKKELFDKFRFDTFFAIENRISLNPILNSFQEVYHQYGILREWVETFLDSMEMDLSANRYSRESYKQYINGSAEVVGLMCLHVFTEGDMKLFRKLQPYAMKLGAAFQKVNFLRDVKADNESLGRTYFPDVDLNNFTYSDKLKIEREITDEFNEALTGIKMLPGSCRYGVYLAYYYYTRLFNKIKKLTPNRILSERVRIPNLQKLVLMVKSNLKYRMNIF